jgi:hypothetical protein
VEQARFFSANWVSLTLASDHSFVEKTPLFKGTRIKSCYEFGGIRYFALDRRVWR